MFDRFSNGGYTTGKWFLGVKEGENETMRKIMLSGLVSTMMMGMALNASAAEKMRIGTEGGYPPFNVTQADGSVTGFDLDIAFALCEKMKVECTIVSQEWNGLIPALQAKRFDFIAASMSITDERRQAIDFSAPYYTNKLNFVGKKGVPMDVSKEAMKGKVIGVQGGTIAGSWLEDNYPDTVMKAYDTQQKAYLDLSAGRLDGILADMFVNWTWLETPEGSDYEFKGEPVYSDDKIAMGIRKGDTKLKERLDAALKEIVEDGTYQAINAKYFPFSIY